MPEIKLTLPEAMTRAVACHQAGNLIEAERLYKAILGAKPDHADALHLLGVIECQRGLPDRGIGFLDKALAIMPEHRDALCNRGNALSALKRPKEALESYDRALRINPKDFNVLWQRGIVLRELNRPQDALGSFDRALEEHPNHFETLCYRGNTLGALKRFEEALEAYGRALAIKPNDPDALCSRAMVLRDLSRHEEALESCESALAIKPDHVQALCNRGRSLSALGRLNEALESYDRALTVNPRDAETLCARGIVLNRLSRAKEALESFDKALAEKPDDTEALNNRGIALLALNRREEALQSYDRVLAINPEHASALNNRGMALLGLDRLEDSLHCFRRALAIKRDPIYHSNLIFALNFDSESTTALHQAERARWRELYAEPFAASISPHTNTPEPNRRLRIGYVSSHFRYQAAIYAFGGAIIHHDPTRFDVVCYSDTIAEDAVSARLHACVHIWHNTTGLSDEALAELIRSDRIDILVDCVGHMGGHRLLVFARKPAPIQVTAWGEPTGTGLKTMDYLFADPVLVPADERSLLAERVYDLPNFLGYWTPEPLPPPTALPALANGYVTFGSFNRLIKIKDPVVRAWAAILRAMPHARLILKLNQIFLDESQLTRLMQLFGSEGIGPERVKLIGRSDRESHFAAYQQVDIALDPFPHGGGMTTLDALWMGVPVVTHPGRTISSRLAAASLTALNLTDFIASDIDDYVGLALAKAANLQALAQIRASLRRRLAESAIGNPKRYARAVEDAYRDMWRTWCANKGTRGSR